MMLVAGSCAIGVDVHHHIAIVWQVFIYGEKIDCEEIAKIPECRTVIFTYFDLKGLRNIKLDQLC